VPVEKRLPAARAVIRVDIQKTQKSCGYGVPLMQFVSEREKLAQWGSFINKVYLSCTLTDIDSDEVGRLSR
jgi:hypothetical protein